MLLLRDQGSEINEVSSVRYGCCPYYTLSVPSERLDNQRKRNAMGNYTQHTFYDPGHYRDVPLLSESKSDKKIPKYMALGFAVLRILYPGRGVCRGDADAWYADAS